jgi:aldehyde reductase
LVNDRKLVSFARQYGMTAAQAALAWLLAQDNVIAIPKSASRKRVQENVGALDHPLTSSQLAELDEIFPPPRHASSLEML